MPMRRLIFRDSSVRRAVGNTCSLAQAMKVLPGPTFTESRRRVLQKQREKVGFFTSELLA